MFSIILQKYLNSSVLKVNTIITILDTNTVTKNRIIKLAIEFPIINLFARYINTNEMMPITTYLKYILKYIFTFSLNPYLNTIYGSTHIHVHNIEHIVPKNIPIMPNILASIIDIIIFKAASIIALYLSCEKNP